MSYVLVKQVIETVHGLPAGAKWVLVALASFSNSTTGATFPSQEAIAERTGQCVRTVRAHLARLERKGYIGRVYRQRGDGSRTSDEYEVVLPTSNSCPDQPAKTAAPPGKKRQDQPANPAGLSIDEQGNEQGRQPPARGRAELELAIQRERTETQRERRLANEQGILLETMRNKKSDERAAFTRELLGEYADDYQPPPPIDVTNDAFLLGEDTD